MQRVQTQFLYDVKCLPDPPVLVQLKLQHVWQMSFLLNVDCSQFLFYFVPQENSFTLKLARLAEPELAVKALLCYIL